MLESQHQNSGQKWDIKITHKLSEKASQFKYLGTTIRSEHLIQEEIKRGLDSRNACYHSVQNILSCLLSKKK
jgi:hypothetical protein